MKIANAALLQFSRQALRARNRRLSKCSRDASRPLNGAADYHPLVLGRYAPSNKRMQRMSAAASKLASAPTADPQRRYIPENYLKKILKKYLKQVP